MVLIMLILFATQFNPKQKKKQITRVFCCFLLRFLPHKELQYFKELIAITKSVFEHNSELLSAI